MDLHHAMIEVICPKCGESIFVHVDYKRSIDFRVFTAECESKVLEDSQSIWAPTDGEMIKDDWPHAIQS